MKMTEQDYRMLIREAKEAQKNAYAPYSGFLVGAALLASDGSLYRGCNIENASFGATNCAERTAVFRAVSEGKKAFLAIAVLGNMTGKEALNYTYPCGICRQVLAEFCYPDFEIIAAKSEEEYQVIALRELVPFHFTL